MHMEDNDELDDYIDKLINDEYIKLIEGDIGLSTCQLFKQNFSVTEPFASGVFIFWKDSFYLLTASHVIDNWSDANKLFVPINEGYIAIVGKGYGTEINNKKNIDVAYIKLKPELIPILTQYYRFIPDIKILNHKENIDGPSLCVFGYPTRNIRKESGKTYGSMYMTNLSKEKVYRYYDLSPISHYIVDFWGKKINIHTNKIEKPKIEHYGLSGCGLWYISIDFDEETGEMISDSTLIGIMTEFKRTKYDCLIGNRIEIIIAAIEENECQ